jgi:hypothetical protein
VLPCAVLPCAVLPELKLPIDREGAVVPAPEFPTMGVNDPKRYAIDAKEAKDAREAKILAARCEALMHDPISASEAKRLVTLRSNGTQLNDTQQLSLDTWWVDVNIGLPNLSELRVEIQAASGSMPDHVKACVKDVFSLKGQQMCRLWCKCKPHNPEDNADVMQVFQRDRKGAAANKPSRDYAAARQHSEEERVRLLSLLNACGFEDQFDRKTVVIGHDDKFPEYDQSKTNEIIECAKKLKALKDSNDNSPTTFKSAQRLLQDGLYIKLQPAGPRADRCGFQFSLQPWKSAVYWSNKVSYDQYVDGSRRSQELLSPCGKGFQVGDKIRVRWPGDTKWWDGEVKNVNASVVVVYCKDYPADTDDLKIFSHSLEDMRTYLIQGSVEITQKTNRRRRDADANKRDTPMVAEPVRVPYEHHQGTPSATMWVSEIDAVELQRRRQLKGTKARIGFKKHAKPKNKCTVAKGRRVGSMPMLPNADQPIEHQKALEDAVQEEQEGDESERHKAKKARTVECGEQQHSAAPL